jgi:hypothetical protein
MESRLSAEEEEARAGGEFEVNAKGQQEIQGSTPREKGEESKRSV